MSFEILKSKSGTDTCKANGFFLHSAYDPLLEASRFVQAVESSFNPEYIFVVEPALSYCCPELKKRFSKAKICAIRFDNFEEYNHVFDDVIFFDREFTNILFNSFSEEVLLNSLFLDWPSSIKAYKELHDECWKQIQSVLLKARDVLATRQYFALRWLKNQFTFFTNLNKTTSINKGVQDVIICGSGPSLKNVLFFIKENRKSVFVIAASSSIQVLLCNGIEPDFCISTDGGYWAKQHLKPLLYYKTKIPLGISSESAVQIKLLETNPIVPLGYDDMSDSFLYDILGIKAQTALRNGTVTGTALNLALSITDANIYLAGIDMAQSKGYSHCQPNILDNLKDKEDNFINSREKRLCTGSFENQALEIYRKWFEDISDTVNKRVYRILDGDEYTNKLGSIKDINVNNIKLNEKITAITFSEIKDNKINLQKIIREFQQNLEKEFWIKNYFPADFISIQRETDIQLKTKKQTALNKKIEVIKKFIEKKTNKNE